MIEVENSKYEFISIGKLKYDTEDGKVLTCDPAIRYDNTKKQLPLNKYGKGPFCEFKLDTEDKNSQGVYLWVVNNEIIYIGQARNIDNRFKGYGHIAPRNCFVRGRSTNCKMNRVALYYFQQGFDIEIYFYKTSNDKVVEDDLLRNIEKVKILDMDISLKYDNLLNHQKYKYRYGSRYHEIFPDLDNIE